MGEEDIRRQKPNVFSMKLLGAEVRPVTSGSRTLRDAINEAMRDWMSSVETTHYILGSVVGPHPFPRDRPRLSVGDRPRDDRAIAPAARPAARPGRGLRRRRQQRGRHVLSVRRADRGRAGRRRSRRPLGPAGRPCLAAVVRPARRAARQLQLRDAGRRRPDLRRAFDLGRARLSRRRARAQLLERHRPRAATRSAATTRRWRPSTRWPAPKASCRRWKARTPWPRRWSWPRGARRRASDRRLPVRPRRQRRRRDRPADGRNERSRSALGLHECAIDSQART